MHSAVFSVEYIRRLAVFVIPILIFFSCGRKYNTQIPIDDAIDVSRIQREVLLRVNQEFIEEEMQVIETFVESKNWKMEITESGLWYEIYSSGNGEKAVTGSTVTLEYTLSLLDGYVCYSSEEFGTLSFRLGFGNVESGLEEGVLLMRAGDKARFIMPPHLAHGLIGDADCIPMRAIIIYDVELTEISSITE